MVRDIKRKNSFNLVKTTDDPENGAVKGMLQNHPLTQIINKPLVSKQERITKSIGKYTGGNIKLYIQIPNYLLDFGKENEMTPSTLCTLAAEGYFMMRRMLDHRYPALMPLFRKMDEHKRLTDRLTEMDNAMDASDKRTEQREKDQFRDKQLFLRRDRNRDNRDDKDDKRTRAVLRIERRRLRRRQYMNFGYFWRHRRQVAYITELQHRQINGGGRPSLPQGIRGKESTTYEYYNEAATQLLTHIGGKLLGRYITKDVCKATGGGTYVHISIPAYLKRHIDATGLQQSLFFILAIDDYLGLADSKLTKNPISMIYNLVLHRAATIRDAPEDRTRAVLFRERNQAVAGLVRTYNKKEPGVKAKQRCTINESVMQTRRDRITVNREGMTDDEMREENIDGFLEMVNDMWNELSTERKKELDLKRFLKEKRESGEADETIRQDPTLVEDEDLDTVADNYPGMLDAEVNRRWKHLNSAQKQRFDKARFDEENANRW